MRRVPKQFNLLSSDWLRLKDNVIRAADRFSQKHRRNGEEIRRVGGRIESGRQESRQLGCGRPERAGQVGSPLRCPWLHILRSRAPFSSRGISVVESIRSLTRLARGAFSIAVVFSSFDISAFARDQHILGITHLAFCIQPEAFRECLFRDDFLPHRCRVRLTCM